MRFTEVQEINLIHQTEPEFVVAAICGSLRRGSFTRAALAIALRGAAELGAQTQMIDLEDYHLGFFGSGDESAHRNGAVRLRRDVGRAQGLILGSPEYHGGFSGVLKNALDLMGFAEFEGKMIGLVGVSGGALGATNALNGLRTIGRALHAWVIPDQVTVPEAHKVFNQDGQLNDPAMERRLKALGRAVARFAYLHASTEAQELMQRWETPASLVAHE
jgi:FMN reductase